MSQDAALRTAGRAYVCAAWKKVLKSDHCDPTLTWRETGADSIATLHLLVELERLGNGCSLTFDSIRPDMTVDDFAALIDEPERVRLAASSSATPVLPVVHLFPGLYGDDPRLANFRQALKSTVNVHLQPLPELSLRARTLRCVKLSGAAAAKVIDARQPEGPVYLAGFSFGGSVAYEAARALHRAGRTVAFVGLLDTILGNALVRKQVAPAKTLEHFKRRLQLACISLDRPRFVWLAVAERLSPLFAHRTRRYMAGLFREYALRAWKPAPLEVNTLLVVSEEYGPKTEPIWQGLCSLLKVVHLPNGHVQMFEQPAIGILAPAFAAAVRRATGGTSEVAEP